MHLNNELLIKLGKKYGTPLYVYDGDLIIKRYKELLSCFKWPKTKLYFAVKCNYNPNILKILCEQGANIDAVSFGEVHMALKCGFIAGQIMYTANSLSDRDAKEGIKLGVLFNIGSLSELERYGKLSPNSKVCLRINPNVVAADIKTNRTGGKNSKFGVQMKDIGKAKEIAKKYNLEIIGLHEHTGSGVSEVGKAYEATEKLLSIAKKEHFPELEFIDFGGGFTVPYEPNENRIDYANFGNAISKRFREFCREYGRELSLYFEPGRYIVAESGTLVVRVNTLKNNDGLLFAAVDSGFPQLIRPAFHGSYHHIINLSNPKGKAGEYNICGNICENSDYFAFGRPIAEIREGDYLAIQTAGAYCYAMGGVYNLFSMPAEVIVADGKDAISRRRLSSEELVNKILEECE